MQIIADFSGREADGCGTDPLCISCNPVLQNPKFVCVLYKTQECWKSARVEQSFNQFTVSC